MQRANLFSRTSLSTALLLALSAGTAQAAEAAADAPQQSQPASDSRHAGNRKDVHAKDLDAVVVTASPLRDTANALSKPAEVLAGERLDEQLSLIHI